MKLLTERTKPLRSIAIPLYKLFIRFRDKTSWNLDTRTIASFPRVNQGKMQINFHSSGRKTLFSVSEGRSKDSGAVQRDIPLIKRCVKLLPITSFLFKVDIWALYLALPKHSWGKNSALHYLSLRIWHTLWNVDGLCRGDRIASLPHLF